MPEWLKPALNSGTQTDPVSVGVRLAMALLLGWMVSLIYKRTRRDIIVAPSFPTTLVLLSALIAMVTQVIGDNVARAFSLVGALSIVRFRTVVRDTQDTAYVIFAVVVGMAVGANDYWVAGLGMAIIGFGAFLLRRSSSQSGGEIGMEESTLSLRVGAAVDPGAIEKSLLAEHLATCKLLSMESAKQGLCFDLRYRVTFKPTSSASSLAKALNRTEGVQSIRLQEVDDEED